MSVRYIGSKARVADAIVDLAGPVGRGRFVDAFCGTGSVAATAANRGWAVAVNDAMPSAVAMTTGALVGYADVPFEKLGGYDVACAYLDALEGQPGFVHSEYSPASEAHAGIARMYFTEENAARLDAMRSQIAEWSADGVLSLNEERLLLADLMQAANRVANISGTYGCFLSSWTSNALRPVEMRARELPNRGTDFTARVGDVFSVETTAEDVVYFDPPYTKRQYAAYYHLLETLTAGDRPEVGGVTGLRPWRDKASEFSYKSRALDALTRLIMGTTARKVLLSYSNEGHVDRERLLAALSEAGRVTMHPIQTIGRYRPNAAASAAGDSVQEYVIEVEPVPARERTNSRRLGQAVYA
ncbi:DNA adenine methylase [Nocardioides sp. GXZ039]|uniref:DNA adenine methylase n=1 Tax=Nocardioides sp. GXZ039 TaxID=3136018 RepID=UPI0030F3FBAA